MTAMTLGLVVALTALEFESDHFLRTELIDDLSGHLRSIDERSTHGESFSAAGGEDFFEGHGISDFSAELLDVDLVACFHAVLFSAGFDNCVCHLSLPLLRAGNLPPVPRISKLFF